MAHTKSGGSTKLGRESNSQRLGIKCQHGEKVAAGQIIIRQRGTRYLPGENVGRGSDDTLYALKGGVVMYRSKIKTRFDGARRKATMVLVRR
ncbi:MAG: 50S ribosomal protein L27 [Candidatus Liptonbacteria bacterium RIFCSPLOWO2_12_FULL_60_15]|uniref:Large ribosomal subunit protein bL27 n=2 Tax=Candidatus Liptoniibacteriota TaxID=1817909 RepID=A0A1G2CP71_9BACT|nr:MAG: 50S ribosomal protein L27 [Candidatus Liptonbacteria bacterium RIFCSPHIGHO2_12_FULL_60_13]OGZ02248.1 MAG: 50S ribosomal protein L27 [Candidatus Liptonbacteria bacterium RIFCSPLOWO2_12_FULL_60_15]